VLLIVEQQLVHLMVFVIFLLLVVLNVSVLLLGMVLIVLLKYVPHMEQRQYQNATDLLMDHVIELMRPVYVYIPGPVPHAVSFMEIVRLLALVVFVTV